MKKFISIILCFVFMFLCSCDKNISVETTKPVSQSISSVKDNITELNSETETSAEQTTLNPYADVEIETSPNDPYSFIIKDRFDRLDQHYDPNYNTFFTYDIDNNGVDELLIGSCGSIGPEYLSEEGEPCYYNYGITLTRLFTIKNGQSLQLVFWAGVPDEEMILDNGFLKKVGTAAYDKTYKSYTYVTIINGSEIKREQYVCKKNEYVYACFENEEFNRKVITKEEFDKGIKEIEGNAQPVEIKWTPLHEYKPVDRIGNG